MLVKTHWPALIPAIKRAGHEPVLVHPLEGDMSCGNCWRRSGCTNQQECCRLSGISDSYCGSWAAGPPTEVCEGLTLGMDLMVQTRNHFLQDPDSE